MNLTVTDLKKRTDQRIAVLQKEAERTHAKAMSDYQDSVDAWKRDHAPTLATNLRALATKAARGAIVTDNDVHAATGRSYGRTRLCADNHVHRNPGNTPTPTDSDYPKLLDLRRFLDLVTDKTVSTTDLQRAGFSKIGQLGL